MFKFIFLVAACIYANVLAAQVAPDIAIGRRLESNSSIERIERGGFKAIDLPLSTEMHSNLANRKPDLNGYYFTDIPSRGLTYRDETPSIAYVGEHPDRAHGYATFHAAANASFTIYARSSPSHRNVMSHTDPVIAIYELKGDVSRRDQLPIAIGEAMDFPYREARLDFVTPRAGLYAVAVYHREPELVFPGDALPFHGFSIEIKGDSGRGFSYPRVVMEVANGITGVLCEQTRGTFFLECHVRPAGCGREEFIGNELIRPTGCDDRSKLSKACDYGFPSGPGVRCSVGKKCIYSQQLDQVICDGVEQDG